MDLQSVLTVSKLPLIPRKKGFPTKKAVGKKKIEGLDAREKGTGVHQFFANVISRIQSGSLSKRRGGKKKEKNFGGIFYEQHGGTCNPVLAQPGTRGLIE